MSLTLHFRFDPIDVGPLPRCSPIEHTQLGMLQDPLRIAPLVEAQKHIGTHQQDQLILGISGMELLHRFIGVAGSFPTKLQIGNGDHPLPFQSQLQHPQPLLRGGRPLRQLLMGRDAVRDHQKLLKPQCLHGHLRRPNVSQMGRIEGAAINTDGSHDVSPSFQI